MATLSYFSWMLIQGTPNETYGNCKERPDTSNVVSNLEIPIGSEDTGYQCFESQNEMNLDDGVDLECGILSNQINWDKTTALIQAINFENIDAKISTELLTSVAFSSGECFIMNVFFFLILLKTKLS